MRFIFFLTLAIGLQGIIIAQNYQVPISDTVQILIDHWGVPHIYAKNERDLFFAQGFNAARDRLFSLKYGEGKLPVPLQKYWEGKN